MSTRPRADKDRQKAQAARLKAARIQAGIKNARQAVPYLTKLVSWRVVYDTYAQYESGLRPMNSVVDDLARAYGVNAEWLLDARNPPAWAVGEQDDDPAAPLAYHHLKEWRAFRRREVETLADDARVPAELILRWEAGEGEISALMLQRLADALETTPGMILDVDPGSLTANQLEGWLDVVRGQVEARERAAKLRAA